MHFFRYLYHQHVRVPRAERPLYRAIYRRRPRQVVQVGLGDGDQVERMLRFAATCAGSEGLAFAGIDLFEARPTSQPGMTYQQAHRRFGTLVDQFSLVPGDPYTALSRAANRLLQTDLLVIRAGHDPASLQHGWLYVPRMLHETSAVLIEEPGPDGSCYRTMDVAEIAHLAADVRVPRKRAA
ncbi:MAG: hypothetical protein QGH11_01890 [Pirellulaceae bacterium]|jgi:hypothetical protein|nr:hypothetical protein [Pirellulaceae bacterium]